MKITTRFDVNSYNLTRSQLNEYHKAEELGDLVNFPKRVKTKELNYSLSSEDAGDKQTLQIDVSKLPFGAKTIEIVVEKTDINLK